MEKIDSLKDVIGAKVAIMVEIVMHILDCSYSDAYYIIVGSDTYHLMQEQVYKTLHDSPQANLSDIGEELRKAGNKLGQMIADTNIKRAMLQMREENIRKND